MNSRLFRQWFFPSTAILLTGGFFAAQASALQFQFASLYPLVGPAGTSTAAQNVGLRQASLKGQFAGYCIIPNSYSQAVVWYSNGVAVNLHPSTATGSYAYATSGTQQVGVTRGIDPSDQQAAVWNGTAQSYVNLNPVGATQSSAYDTNGTQQVGYVFGSITGNGRHAALWSGTAQSFLDLHPTGDYVHSYAFGIRGNNQVGEVLYHLDGGSYDNHAALWSGTAQSFVDLHPAGYYASRALGVHGNQQVGDVTLVMNTTNHAAVWNGTAESFVDLHSEGFRLSRALDTNGVYQVGWAYGQSTNGGDHAFLWSGSASSAIDLHNYLPSKYSSSYALGIDGNTIYGFAFWHAPDYTLSGEAVQWTIVPEPASLSLIGLGAIGLLKRRRIP